MREVGELLRRTREEKGLTLKDAQSATKIRTRYLEALERGDDSTVPGEVYFRGFLRSYANFLGLDGQELAARYRAFKEAQRAAQAPPVPSRKLPRGPAWRSLPLSGIVILLVALSFLAWWAWQSGYLPTGAGPREPAPPPGQAGPGTTPAGPGPGGPQATPGPGGEPGGGGAPPAGGQPPAPALERVASPPGQVRLLARGVPGLEVKASFADRCWVRVSTEGQVREETTFGPGQEKTWQARSSLRLRLGNAGAVALTVNGVAVGRPGAAGQVVDVIVEAAP